MAAATRHSISGYVYCDVNNNGIMDSVEMRLPNVPITLTGSAERTVLSGPDGHYSFTELPSGIYHVRETQPLAFIDGIDTPGNPSKGGVQDDFFHDVELSGDTTHATQYNFGEWGLRAELVSMIFFLASSSPQRLAIEQHLTVNGEGRWIPIQPSFDALMTTEVEAEGADVQIELYTSDMLPVRLSHDVSSQTVAVFEDQQYLLYIGGDQPEMAVTIRLGDPGPPFAYQNVDNALDVNGDQYVSPIDALLVISALNRTGARSLSGINDTSHFVDVNGDGFLSPVDALLVITHLNDPGNAEGEPVLGQAEFEAEGEDDTSFLVEGSRLSHSVDVVAAPTTSGMQPLLSSSGQSSSEAGRGQILLSAPALPWMGPIQNTGQRPPWTPFRLEDLEEDESDSLLTDLAEDIMMEDHDTELVDKVLRRWR